MSSAQLLITMLVTLLVFGPKKLPMLAHHLGQLITRIERYKNQARALWQTQLNEQLLQENQRKALNADALYQQDRTKS